MTYDDEFYDDEYDDEAEGVEYHFESEDDMNAYLEALANEVLRGRLNDLDAEEAELEADFAELEHAVGHKLSGGDLQQMLEYIDQNPDVGDLGQLYAESVGSLDLNDDETTVNVLADALDDGSGE